MTLADGTDAIVTVRDVPETDAQFALIQPVDAALADWRWDARIEITLLICTGLLLPCSAAASVISRLPRLSRSADGFADELTEALPGCGVWRWNLARGHVHWSAPMYRLLGLEPRDDAMAVPRHPQALHPDDDLRGGPTATSAKAMSASMDASGSAMPRAIGSVSGCAAISPATPTAASRA